MGEKADTELVRRQNRLLVLDTLRQHGSQARIDIGRRTGLSPATVTTITAQLIAEGVLEEVDGLPEPDQPVKRGRPQTQLDIRPRSAYVVAVSISIDGIVLALSDGRGHIVARMNSKIATRSAKPNNFGVQVAEEIANFLKSARVEFENVAFIGVAIQGVADSQNGQISWSPAFGTRDIPVAAVISERLGIPCQVANDANMIAEGLISSDRQRYSGTTAVIFIGWGVGMGLIINGQVYHGPTGAASEFGHMNHLPEGPLCRCGRRGCVEAYVADYSLLRWASGNAATQPPSTSAIAREDMLALETAARRGEAQALSAYAKAGEALGYGLARLISILTPSRIVLAGPGTSAMDRIRPHLENALEAAVVEELRRHIEIETVPIETDMIIKGTIDRALRHVDRETFAHGPLPKRSHELESVA